MSDVEAARRAWIQDRPKFERFGAAVAQRLRKVLRRQGVLATVSYRAKDIDSLVKKLLVKGEDTYETLPDKVGARVIVKYRSDIKAVLNAISAVLDHDQPDDKAGDRGITEVGYLSVHLDRAVFKEQDAEAAVYPPSVFFAEIQIRTQAQHLWAEMAHDSVYKNNEIAEQLSPEFKRTVHLMAGLIEVADREFDRFNSHVGQNNDRYQLFHALEKNYFKLTLRRPNPQLSMAVIDLLIPTFGSLPIGSIIDTLDRTFNENAALLESVYQDPDKSEEISAFLFQPEALLIYDRLINDRDRVLEAWNEAFPESELERVANAFGMTLY